MPLSVARLPAGKSLVPHLSWMKGVMVNVGVGFSWGKCDLADVSDKPYPSISERNYEKRRFSGSGMHRRIRWRRRHVKAAF